MKGLLVKDIRFILGQKSSLIIFVVLGLFFLLTGEEATFGLVYTMLLAALFSTSSISYDAHENGMAFLLTLPIRKKDYVIGKYVFALIVIAVMGVIMYLMTFGCDALGIREIDSNMLNETLATSVIMAIIMSCLMIPVYVIFGADKARIAIMVIAGIAAVGYFIISKVFGDSLSKVTELLIKLEGLNDWQSALLTIGILLVIMAGSMLITMTGLEKKEY